MRVFISWSGETSKAVAEALRDWLPKVIQAVRPWMTAVDLFPGDRWSAEIAEKLEEVQTGITCLTADNLEAPWIHFEAGAISKLRDAVLIPFLFNVQQSDVPQGPLSQFQGVKADEAGAKALVESINKRVEEPLLDTQLEEQFKMYWPGLKKRLDDIASSSQAEGPPPRSEREILEEILALVRRRERRPGEEERREALYFRLGQALAEESSSRTPRWGELLSTALVPASEHMTLDRVAERMKEEFWKAAVRRVQEEEEEKEKERERQERNNVDADPKE